MATTLINHINIGHGDEVSISLKKNYKVANMPNYVRHGLTKNGEEIIDILCELTKGSLLFFKKINKQRNKNTNLFTLSKLETPSEVNMQNLALKELENRNLIKKVKGKVLGYEMPPKTFIINPLLIIPKTNSDFEEAYTNWMNITGK